MWVNQGASSAQRDSLRFSASSKHQQHDLHKLADSLRSLRSENDSIRSKSSVSLERHGSNCSSSGEIRFTRVRYGNPDINVDKSMPARRNSNENENNTQEHQDEISSSKSARKPLLKSLSLRAKKENALNSNSNNTSNNYFQDDLSSHEEENNTDVFITLATPKSTSSSTTSVLLCDIYSLKTKKIKLDFSFIIQSSIYDLVEGCLDIPDSSQSLLFNQVDAYRYKIVYEDHGRNDILLSERNAARYFERCLDRGDSPQLFIHFAHNVISDLTT